MVARKFDAADKTICYFSQGLYSTLNQKEIAALSSSHHHKVLEVQESR
jgi:hypothetical protein